jgi:formate--tetrahydrofolate ligase
VDLGAEKYIDIVSQTTGLNPAAAVMVTTAQSLRNQGGGELEKGLPNLGQHLSIMRTCGLPTVVALNRFPSDSAEDLRRLREYCEAQGVTSELSTAFVDGGAGAEDLARRVVELADKGPKEPAVAPVYRLADTLEEKVQAVAKSVYGARGVQFSENAKSN